MRTSTARHPRFLVGMILGLLVGVAMAGGIAVAAIPDSDDGEIHACADKKSGLLRVIDHEAGAQCRINEIPLDWSAGATCPPGTIPFTGACFETAERPDPKGIQDATADCADEGGRLPSSAELNAFARQPGIDFPNGEWSSDMGDHEGTFRFLVFTDPGNGLEDAFEPVHYRCVLSPIS